MTFGEVRLCEVSSSYRFASVNLSRDVSHIPSCCGCRRASLVKCDSHRCWPYFATFVQPSDAVTRSGDGLRYTNFRAVIDAALSHVTSNIWERNWLQHSRRRNGQAAYLFVKLSVSCRQSALHRDRIMLSHMRGICHRHSAMQSCRHPMIVAYRGSCYDSSSYINFVRTQVCEDMSLWIARQLDLRGCEFFFGHRHNRDADDIVKGRKYTLSCLKYVWNLDLSYVECLVF